MLPSQISNITDDMADSIGATADRSSNVIDFSSNSCDKTKTQQTNMTESAETNSKEQPSDTTCLTADSCFNTGLQPKTENDAGKKKHQPHRTRIDVGSGRITKDNTPYITDPNIDRASATASNDGPTQRKNSQISDGGATTNEQPFYTTDSIAVCNLYAEEHEHTISTTDTYVTTTEEQRGICNATLTSDNATADKQLSITKVKTEDHMEDSDTSVEKQPPDTFEQTCTNKEKRASRNTDVTEARDAIRQGKLPSVTGVPSGHDVTNSEQEYNDSVSESPVKGDNTWNGIVKIVKGLYPDLLTRTYVVPPIHFNKVPYVRRNVPGANVTAHVIQSSCGGDPPEHDPPLNKSNTMPPVPQIMWNLGSEQPVTVLESDFRGDFAQNHVLLNLQALGQKLREVMFILSQLNFGSYLNQPAYAAAAAHLPRPSQLNSKGTNYCDGEADLLLIHRRLGILVGKIKSLGRNKVGMKKELMVNRIRQAARQLDRAAKVVTFILSDVAPKLSLVKTVILPYVDRHQLHQLLVEDPCLEEEMCTILGTTNALEASLLCCCSDDLSDPDTYWDMSVLSRLEAWWLRMMTCTVGSQLTEEQYIEIVARFVGPASEVQVQCNISPRVEVRTEGQAIAELGWRLAHLILTLQQVDLLNRNPQIVCITGPPGTGKSVVLTLQGLRWLLQGHDVHIVITNAANQAVSFLIHRQMTETARVHPGKSGSVSGTVIVHEYDFANREEDVTKAVTELKNAQQNGTLCVILDEVTFVSSETVGTRNASFIGQLFLCVHDLHFWTAGVDNREVPTRLLTENFNTPLRCAPVVLREVKKGVARHHVQDYCNSGFPAPGDGPAVTQLLHHGRGHKGAWPVECWQCGQDVANVLQRLGVGIGNTNEGNSISYRDVFILTRSSELKDEVRNKANLVEKPACGFVRGLRAAHLPVCVFGHQVCEQDRIEWWKKVHDVAVAASDRITVATWHEVNGLERRIVVTLQGRNRNTDDGYTTEDIDDIDRFHAVSRCTTQLIRVELPSPSNYICFAINAAITENPCAT